LSAIVICPSNPYLSIDPILALGGVRDTLSARSVPLVVVSPLVGRTSVKGPLAKLMGELGKPVTNLSIAEHYQGLLDHIVIDQSDAEDAQALRARPWRHRYPDDDARRGRSGTIGTRNLGSGPSQRLNFSSASRYTQRPSNGRVVWRLKRNASLPDADGAFVIGLVARGLSAGDGEDAG
jgi:hypothetical protein